ncbi:MAG: hypothetical protein ACO3CQ_00180 [Candidatus Nanopelagicaceae bacterium]
MEELIDLIVSDESPSNVSDKIKDILFAKAAEKVDSVKPEIAATFFNSDD